MRGACIAARSAASDAPFLRASGSGRLRRSATFAALALSLGLAVAAAAADRPARPAPATTADVLRLTDEIAAKVAALRGLPLRSPIEKSLISREDARALFASHAGKDRSREEIAAEGALLVKLGLMPAGTPYWELVLDLLAEQVAGFYDTDRRMLFLADWLGPDPVALAHEITHALQDQHFNLRRWEKRMLESSDFGLAFSAVAEGDAVGSMIDYGLRGISSFTDTPRIVESMREEYAKSSKPAPGKVSESPLFDAAPAVLRKTLLFPYIEGFTFIHAMRRRGPWSDVDRLYLDPPVSTEQILHFDKFLARELPLEVPLPLSPALEATGHVALHDVLGEYQIATMLEAAMPAAAARDAAAGWGGDRIAVYVPDAAPIGDPATPEELAQVVFVARVVFDDEREAKEAALAFGAYGDATVDRRGRTVLWLVGVPPPIRDRVVGELWAGWAGAPPAR